MEYLENHGSYRTLLMPDHFTPVSLRMHSPEPVPFAICGAGVEADEVAEINEESTAKGHLSQVVGHRLMALLTSEGFKKEICQ